MNKQNELPDELNPEYLFTLTHNQLLSDIVNGKIDCVEIARKTLIDRGFDDDGKTWIGFK